MSNDFYILSILPHKAIIIKICRAYTNTQEDFEDYYQEVCLQIWRSKDSFKQQSEWTTWIYRISLYVCMSLLKKKKNNRQHFISDYLPPVVIEDSKVFIDEDLNMLYDAIKQLSEVDRAIILLYLEEKPYQEIAEIIGTNPNNIGVRVKRIKDRLKKLITTKIKTHEKVN